MGGGGRNRRRGGDGGHAPEVVATGQSCRARREGPPEGENVGGLARQHGARLETHRRQPLHEPADAAKNRDRGARNRCADPRNDRNARPYP